MIGYGGPPVEHVDSLGTPAASHTNDLFALTFLPTRDINICNKRCFNRCKINKIYGKILKLRKEFASCDRKSDRFHLRCFWLSTHASETKLKIRNLHAHLGSLVL